LATDYRLLARRLSDNSAKWALPIATSATQRNLSMCDSTPRRTDVSGNISWTPVVSILCEATPFPGVRVLPRTGGIPMETIAMRPRLSVLARRCCHAAWLSGCPTALVAAHEPASTQSPPTTVAPTYKVGDTPQNPLPAPRNGPSCFPGLPCLVAPLLARRAATDDRFTDAPNCPAKGGLHETE
jgi:hypothetical protein